MRIHYLIAGAVAASFLATAPVRADGQEQKAQKAGCLACHKVDKKAIGPTYQDVAKKYKGQAGAEALLIEKVRKGGKGVWGAVPMPPNPVAKISDDDLKDVVEWILGL
ncbi:MAG: c-type cytochrome [Xanthobacteraceae bacterium]|nr:MAG: c-type cytochrome [Xanthobacteraceae bacterium]